MLRLALAVGVCGVLIVSTASVVWLRIHIVPPDCADAETLSLVRRSLTGRFHLPSSATIENVRTLAGGYVAFRFACEADLRGIDPHDLPEGAAVPGSVHYVSRLTADHQRHEVTVSIQPLLKLERVQ